jgi:hypothetical protein
VLRKLLPDRFFIVADGAAAAVLAFSVDRARPVVVRKWGAQAGWIPVLAAVLAVLPLFPLPYQAARVAPVPVGWQADTGQPGSLIGGYFIGPGPGRRQVFYSTPTTQYLYQLWIGRVSAGGPAARQAEAGLASMRPAAIVAVTSQGSALGQLLTGVFGRPSFDVGAVLVWRHPAAHTVARG